MTQVERLSVIIPAKNAGETLEACVRSLVEDLGRAGVAYEVLIIDDASVDRAPQTVVEQFPQVKLIRSGVAVGYARANNMGFRATTGDAILLLNADTIIVSGCIAALMDLLRGHPRMAAFGATLLNPDGTIQRSCWRFPLRSLIGNALWLFRIGIWDDYRSWDHHADRQVDWITSAALMVRRSAVESVGVFDEGFWVYNVEVDWALRARRHGYLFLSAGAARVIHRGGASWGGASDRQYEDKMWSLALLFRKHYGMAGLAFFHTVVFVNSLVRIAVWTVPSLLGLGSAKRKLAEFGRVVRWSLFGRVGPSTRPDLQRRP